MSLLYRRKPRHQSNYRRDHQALKNCVLSDLHKSLEAWQFRDEAEIARATWQRKKMPLKKLDNRLRVLIENGVALNHRTLFVIVGEKGKDQVAVLHHILSKATVKVRPNVLWCYKKELGFSSHRKKRMRQMRKKLRTGAVSIDEDNPFEVFLSATNIRYCYYDQTDRILGNTYGMCVLQDFEALTPNLLARTIETVEGGGVVVVLLHSMTSLKQLYTMAMDVHSRYRTESHTDVVGRFNERFILSITSCKHCLVINDQLSVLPVGSHMSHIEAIPFRNDVESQSATEKELVSLKESLQGTEPVGPLLALTKTLDQGKTLLKFVEAISEKTLRTTVALTAARGRGKSAALGLAIAAAVGFSYSNIFVTSPSPENLKTLFEFVLKGFDALQYKEHEDYEVIKSTNKDFKDSVVRINLYHDHRQTVQYIHPTDYHKLGQAELVCIDEAAAIPLPLVKKLMGPYLVFLASTINGYEGTGRSLSLKLLEQLRQQSVLTGISASSKTAGTTTGRILFEVSLNESIRYSPGDPVEQWLNNLLCLNAASVPRITTGCPPPKDCELYYVNRDTLFCYHKASEHFLHNLMSLYVSSHYKNSPNDLQLLSDAPAHHMFVLVPPVTVDQTSLPDVLCVLQVCLEGEISKESAKESLKRGRAPSGDMIPWTLSQQFVDQDFPSLSGARVVRIATHPDLQGMGYGSRSLQLLRDYYEGRIPCMEEEEVTMATTSTEEDNDKEVEDNEEIAPRTKLPPLLAKLSERPAETLDYLGVSYGLTYPLLKFWKRAGFVPVYVRQTPSDLTGEHSCIMLSPLEMSGSTGCIMAYNKDFCQRFLSLLSYQFREFSPSLALSLLQSAKVSDSKVETTPLTYDELRALYNQYDLKRLELYSRNMADHHLITDLLPGLSRLYCNKKSTFNLSAIQSAILLGLGLQHKSVEKLEEELDMPSSQIMGLYNRLIRKFNGQFRSLEEEEAGKDLPITLPASTEMEAMEEDLETELRGAAKEMEKKFSEERKQLDAMDLSKYAISTKESEWNAALSSGKDMAVVSVARSDKRKATDVGSGKASKKLKKRHK